MSGSGRVLLVEEGGAGGVAEYTGALAAALARAGWGVELATARDHGYEPAPGVAVHRLFPYVRGRTTVGRAIRRAKLSKPVNGLTHFVATFGLLAISRRCDVVHVQGGEWPPLGAIQALLIRALGRPLVWTPHNTFDRGERSYSRTRALAERCATRIVIHAEYDRGTLSPAGAGRAVVIPHGEYGSVARRDRPALDPPAARAAVGAGEDELVVLLFGQLRRDKGITDLLEAAADVEGVRVVLAGEDKGALGEAGAWLADPRLSDRVVVSAGFVPAHLVGELFAAADVVALPYHRASASGVLLLAYGYGRPVVAYPVGGLPEYVLDGHTGWICSSAHPAALAQELRIIAGAGREACRERGAAAQHLADERFSWHAIAQRTGTIYRELAGRRYAPAVR